MRQVQPELEDAALTGRVPSWDACGAAGACALFCCSLTPSLLPRDWPIQSVVSGTAAALGYAVGVLVGQLARAVVPRRRRSRIPATAARRARAVLALACAAAVLLVSYASWSWQRDIRRLIGWPAPAWYAPVQVLVGSVVVLAAAVAAARALRLSSARATRRLRRLFPAPVASPASAVTLALVVALGLRGVVDVGLLPATDAVFRVINGSGSQAPVACAPATVPACAATDPGSLGRYGRRFLARTPTAARLRAFRDGPAVRPLRVYASLGRSPDLEAEARRAAALLDRAGGFHRHVLLIATSTGTGWVDPNAVSPLEYMWRGAVATVSMQYSDLPSSLQFVTDRSTATRAATLLIDAVRDRWRTLPAAQRPLLLVFGESLGALGSQDAFAGLTDVLRDTDGALWEGPPNDSTVWRRLETARVPGSPEIRPDPGPRPVRFAVAPTDLRLEPALPRPHVVYLQHATDPVVWWSPRLLWQRPDWLRETRGPDVTPAMRWYPVVTFLQVTADLAWATHVPSGHGHNYHTDAAAGWAVITRPPGWSDRDTTRLARTLAAASRL